MIRKAKINDAIGILEIRNNKDIRALSNNKEEITLENHLKWFRGNLANNKNINFVYIDENDSVIGYCRLDYKEEKKYIISIAFSPNCLSKGLGSELIQTSLSSLEKGDIIDAEILDNNIISINFFRKFGFKKEYDILYRLII